MLISHNASAWDLYALLALDSSFLLKHTLGSTRWCKKLGPWHLDWVLALGFSMTNLQSVTEGSWVNHEIESMCGCPCLSNIEKKLSPRIGASCWITVTHNCIVIFLERRGAWHQLDYKEHGEWNLAIAHLIRSKSEAKSNSSFSEFISDNIRN